MKLLIQLKRFLKKEESQVQHIEENANSFISEEAQLIRQRIERRKLKQRKLKLILRILLSLVVIFGTIAAYSQYKLQTLTEDELLVDTPKEKQPRTGEEIVKALGRHVLLPDGSPQIAEVQDAARLKMTQAFFEKAENGDVVVVYDSVIFLYRPSKDIVIASGDISGLGQ
jgi:hypothetical protein